MGAYDAIVVGAGHNGLVAATLLARAGRKVLVLERGEELGGAAVSGSPFAGVDARISRYAYLVSLFPRSLIRELGLEVELRRRRISSYTPTGDAGILVCDDPGRTRASMVRTLGSDTGADALDAFGALAARLAEPVFSSLTEPLPTRAALRARVGDERAWDAVCERPLSELLASTFESRLVRGIVATDALIGTFAGLDDPRLRQNRCFLYHVIGNGTGRWDVPVGGMGAVTTGLARGAVAAGAELSPGVGVGAIDADERGAEVYTDDGRHFAAHHLLANVAPSVLAALTGDPAPEEPARGLPAEAQPAPSRGFPACATQR